MKSGTEKRKLLVIAGPTAVGKSALGVQLAKEYNGEVISADSRQVYKGLDIGTGKITKKEMRGVPHHLLDVASPKKQFSVAEFQKLARKKIDDIHSRGKLPIIVGGTGLYIDTLLGKFTIPEVPPNPKLRKELERKTTERLFTMLQKLDPRRAKTIDRHNPRRLVRAIEIVKALGKVPPLQHSNILENVGVFYIGLALPHAVLKKNIAKRLQKRVRGMIVEVKRLHVAGLAWKRMEVFGLEYRYIARFLQKKVSREEMLAQLEKEIGYYAKRQMTWFKRNGEIEWFSPMEAKKIGKLAQKFLRKTSS